MFSSLGPLGGSPQCTQNMSCKHTLKNLVKNWMLCFLFCFFIWWKGEVWVAATYMACKSRLNWSLKRQYPIILISWKLCPWITQAEPGVC